MVLRENYLDKLWKYKDLQTIKVITGIRRCGKSTLLKQFQNKLIESGVDASQIVSLNFEELENESLLDYKALYSYLKSKLCVGKFIYFFLDEIQNVPFYEKAIDSLYVKDNVDIYITGSNAYLLSSEIATLLSGRYIEINMLPFSFKEYKEMMEQTDKQKAFADYMEHGGMPYAALIRKSTHGSDSDYIDGVFSTVLVNDVIEQNQRIKKSDSSKRNVSDIPLLKSISKYLSSVIGSPVSYKSIADYLSSNGRKTSHSTVCEYIQALEQSYLFYKADRMDVQGKTLFKQNQKYYIVDLGFRRHILAKQKYDIGFKLENIVYLELLRRDYEVHVGKIGTNEVDFVAFKDGAYSYFQVTASMLDEKTFNREITPLKNIKDNYSKVILTNDSLGLGDYNGIKVVNIVDWLLEDK